MNQDVTLYRIIKLFEDYQQSQTNIGLNGFGYGNLIDFGQNLTGGTQTHYPFMFVTPQNISYDENITTYTMSIIFADRLNDDKSNTVDVQSDMSIQAKRLMGWIRRGIDNTPDLFDNMDINLPTTGIPFLERFNDYLGGIAIDLEVVVQESIDSCNYYTIYPPNTIPNLYVWYDFQDTDTITLTGGTDIVGVSDKSGNNYDLTPFSASPVYSASTYTNSNGYYAMWENGNDTAMIHNLSSTKNFTDITGFVVYTRPNDNVRNIYGVYTGSTSNTTQSPMVNWNIGEDLSVWSNMACGEIEGNSSYQETDAMILRQRVFSTTLGDFDGDEYSKYGVLNADPNDCSFDNVVDFANTIILGKNDAVSPFNNPMGIFEVIIYDRALTDVEYNGVLDYLKNKYNYNNWV